METTDAGSLLDLINGARAAAGVPILRADTALSLLAEKHSEDMEAAGRLDRLQPEDLASFSWTKIAQLLLSRSGSPPATMQDAFTNLNGRPTDHTNMLDPAFATVGIGVARQGNEVWVTVIFID